MTKRPSRQTPSRTALLIRGTLQDIAAVLATAAFVAAVFYGSQVVALFIILSRTSE